MMQPDKGLFTLRRGASLARRAAYNLRTTNVRPASPMLEQQAKPIHTHKLTTSNGKRFEFFEIHSIPTMSGPQEAATEPELTTFRGLISVHADFVYAFDANKRLTFANQALLRLWGLKKEEAVGRNLQELGYPQELVELHECQLNVALQGKTLRGENSFQGADGDVRHYEYIFAPLKDDSDAVSSVVGITRDVTHRKQLEQERERLLSAIAHDLRTPLNVIAAGSSLVEIEPSADLIRTIKSNAWRAVRMVDDLLDSARIQAGQSLQLRRDSHDLRKICQEMTEEMTILHGDRFHASLPPDDVSCQAELDGDAIRRIIANLATNAVKYGQSRGKVTIALSKPENERFSLSVHNQCDEPISQRELQEFFRPFWRSANQDPDNSPNGWGLGLATAAQLAKAHGGHLTARSDEENGTVFELNLPATQAAEPAR